MGNYLFTSESVADGHPDKIADQLSDAVLDACLAQDPESKVACEAVVTTGLVMLSGEITSKAQLDFDKIVRKTIQEIGYADCKLGFDYHSCGIITSIHEQSPDIAQGVNEGQGLYQEQGAGDQGLMFGYACDETPELMPLPIMLSHGLLDKLREKRKSGELPYLRPDAKSQVTVEYDKDHNPTRIHTIVVSAQHAEDVDHKTVTRDVKQVAQEVVPKGMIDDNTIFYINPTGRFVIGGPVGDSGLTGRKLMVDTYGGMARHGGGAFSGKDPSKVDRSAAYACRHVAKNIVAAKLAKRCEVQVSYAIGVAKPVSIFVDTYGTGKVADTLLAEAVDQVFDLRPKSIIDYFNLRRPIYRQTAAGGHFGRHGDIFTWENTEKVEPLLEAIASTNGASKMSA